MNIATICILAAGYVVVGDGCLLPGVSGEGTQVRVEWPMSREVKPAPKAPAASKRECEWGE